MIWTALLLLSLAASPPDIVLIVTDDRPPNSLTYMPLTRALVKGVRFTNAFVSTPVCCPSRASILTGLYSHNHGVKSNFGAIGGAKLFDPTLTIATRLQSAGYRTGLFGKYMNGYSGPATPPGWDDWHAHVSEGAYYDYDLAENGSIAHYDSGDGNYSVNVIKQRALEFIGSTPPGQPLFLHFNPIAPHSSCVSPPSAETCQPASPIPAAADSGMFDSIPRYRPPSYDEADVSDKPRWIQELRRLSRKQRINTDRDYRRSMEALQSVDRAVAEIVDALAENERLANAVIIFTADNGLSMGAHRWIRKGCVYEACIKVPLLIRGRGFRRRSEAALVTNVDLAPTILELAGAEPLPTNGRSLVPLLHDPAAPWRDAILLENLGWARDVTFHYANFQAVRTSRYVYAEYMNGDQELYDLSVDPDQMRNVVNDRSYTAAVQELRVRLEVLRRE